MARRARAADDPGPGAVATAPATSEAPEGDGAAIPFDMLAPFAPFGGASPFEVFATGVKTGAPASPRVLAGGVARAGSFRNRRRASGWGNQVASTSRACATVRPPNAASKASWFASVGRAFSKA